MNGNVGRASLLPLLARPTLDLRYRARVSARWAGETPALHCPQARFMFSMPAQAKGHGEKHQTALRVLKETRSNQICC